MAEDWKCMVCGGRMAEDWALACRDYYLPREGTVDYVECRCCGLVQQALPPKDTSALYDDYPVHADKGRVHEFVRKVLLRHAYFPVTACHKDAFVLDFGCGDGFYLRLIRAKVGRIAGFEPGLEIANRLSSVLDVPVYNDLSVMRQACRGQVDVVVAHYVLEHLTDLHSAFDAFADILKLQGLLGVTLPNIRSWEAQLFGRKWHGLDAPRHISFPERESLNRLAAEHGFACVAQRQAAFPNTLAASVVNVFCGRYIHGVFGAVLPFTCAISFLASSGTTAFTFKRI